MAHPVRAPIVSAEALLERVTDPRLRLADVRWFLGDLARGRAEYALGHIPGAIFVDLDRDLAAASGPGRHPLPDPTSFADRLGELGFGDQHDIVAYDQVSGTVAARLWWMLDQLGHHDVAVLDGGLPAWTAAGGELTTIVPTHLRSSLALSNAWPETVDRERVTADIHDLDLVDLRAAERYRGEVEPIDRVAGHIPGARNQPAQSLLDASGRFLPPDRLAVLLEGPPDKPMVMSCGSGVTACFGAIAARLASLPDPLIYPGSYSDWSSSGMPVATGDAAHSAAPAD